MAELVKINNDTNIVDLLHQMIDDLESNKVTCKEGILIYRSKNDMYHYYLLQSDLERSIALCDIGKQILIDKIRK